MNRRPSPYPAPPERERIAAQLALMVSSIYQYYLNHGYHTFAYWIAHEPGEGILADALADFVEDHYPAEWRAAWEPYDNDPACLPRDPRPATTATEEAPAP